VKPEGSIMTMISKSIQTTILVLAIAVTATTTASADAAKANLRNELGITYAKDGHFDDALRSFSLILAEDPDHAAALNNSGNIYFVQGEMARAQKLYERAIQSESAEGGIHLNLGILLHSIGEDQASAASVRQGLDLIGDPHEAYYLLGLSKQPPSDNDRAADASDLQASEIEALLASAMADIPSAAKTQTTTPGATDKDGKTINTTQTAATTAAAPKAISTRPGGAKASQAEGDIVADRLFWMSSPKNP